MMYVDFEGHQISRIIKGCWQLAGGHGEISPEQAAIDTAAYVAHGINTFDMGDIYMGAEQAMGDFLAAYRIEYGDTAASELRMHTKFVPDLDALADLTEKDIRSVIERSCARLGLERLDLVQFHWWDLGRGDFVAAAKVLEQLRREGLIETIGLTNFDVVSTKKLLEAGITIKSNQIQFSLLDPRPFNGMLEFAQDNNIALFCYGTLAGGLLGSAKPQPEATNRSHIKYNLMIDEVGRDYYEGLLLKLKVLAEKYNTTVANIACRYALQTPGVTGVILGPRNTKHIAELNQLFIEPLSDTDHAELTTYARQPLSRMPDDIYSFERDRSSVHGRIMKYNINRMRPERS